MNLRQALLEEHSRERALLITEWIEGRADRFADLVACVLDEQYRLSQRAAWALRFAAERYPFLLTPHLPHMIHRIGEPKTPDAVKRNVLRILQDVDLPEDEDLLGQLAEYGFQFLADPKEAVAIRVFSMSVLWKICQRIPELSDELRMTIEDHFEHGTAGFKSRGRKILKAIGKGK